MTGSNIVIDGSWLAEMGTFFSAATRVLAANMQTCAAF